MRSVIDVFVYDCSGLDLSLRQMTSELTKEQEQVGARTFASTLVKVGVPLHLKNRSPLYGSRLIFPQFVHELSWDAVCQMNELAVTFTNVTLFAVTVIVSK